MECRLIEDTLVPFHFGALDEPSRAPIEAHLEDCAACLRAYLQLKRHIELPTLTARPSAKLRDRLRADVAREFTSPRVVPPALFSRGGRVALGAGLALGALLALYIHRPSPRELHAARTIDSARSAALSLHTL